MSKQNNINPSLSAADHSINPSLPKLPLVSICCITYNHAPFIRQCLEGFLMQKLDLSALPFREEYEVDFEILIHDDCSTDGTTEIVKEYAAKYPDLIKPLYETENQYSKGVWVDGYNYRRAQGKYIAYCEGDDYWTDPLKLQKQVAFMETHPDFSVCFTDYLNYIIDKNQYIETGACKFLHERCQIGATYAEVSFVDYFAYCITLPVTMVFRHEILDLSWSKRYKYYRDTHEIYHFMKEGKCAILNFVSAKHNIHSGGVAGMISMKKSLSSVVNTDKELYEVNNDEYTKQAYINALHWAIINTQPLHKDRILYSWYYYLINRNLFTLMHHIFFKCN